MENFLAEVIEETKNEYAAIVENGIAGDDCEFINSGSYSLNALISGSIYGGIPDNTVTALAGATMVGKTYFLLSIIKNFLDDKPTGQVVLFESESALTKKMIVERGLDPKRIAIMPVVTVQQFKNQAIVILEKYLKMKPKQRPPLFMALDSLGNLSTEKEMQDSIEHKEVKDMTRPGIIKAAFRVLTLNLGIAKVPLVITNHVYSTIGMFSQKVMSGGSGLDYAASTTIFLSKKKDKVSEKVVGNIIHCRSHKSRFTVPDRVIDTNLNYQTGLNKYWGLLELGEKYKIFENLGGKYVFSGAPVSVKDIYKNPEKYFTPEILDKLDHVAKKEFVYGNAQEEDVPEEKPEIKVKKGRPKKV